ncbi:MAG: OmpA family protein [Deltaproteobacteria bacterium]|nr:OmpA family protein [Deltaproteobacteria bacterium]
MTIVIDSRIKLGRRVAAAALLTIAAGCASRQTPELQALRTRYDQEKPRLDQLAPVASDDARVAIDKVAGAVTSGAEREEVTHLVYVANKRIDVAEARADERAATDEVAKLSAGTSASRDRRTRKRGQRRARSAAASAGVRATEASQRASDAEARNRALQSQLSELQARETDRGIVLTLGDVLFDVDRTTLKAGARTSLEKLVSFLNENPDRNVEIEGHTDSTGSRDHNEELSQARAESVATFLASRGIGGDRVQTRGLAFDYPVASNDTTAGRQLNRRVETIIANGSPTSTTTSRSSSYQSTTSATAAPR